MKHFFAFVTIMSIALPIVVGCDKKAEVKTTTTTTTPEGTTTETDTHKVETNK